MTGEFALRDRRLLPVLVLLTVASGLAPLSPRVALASTNSTLSVVTHTPPIESIGGDAVTLSAAITRNCAIGYSCTDPTLNVLRPDGTLIASKKGSSAASQTISISIAGTNIRFPAFQYALVASFEETIGFASPQTSPPSSSSAALKRQVVSARYPATGSVSVPTQVETRFTLKRPDGTPAAGANVIARADSNQESWQLTTDALGKIRHRIPASSSWLQARLMSGYGNLYYAALEGGPTTQLTAPQSFSVLVGDLATPIGFNSQISVDPISADVQDKTVTLRQVQQVFSTQTASSEPCGPGECDGRGYCQGSNGSVETCSFATDNGTTDVPVAANVGAGVGVQNTNHYEISTSTGSSVATSIDGGDWVEVTGEKRTETTATAATSTGWFADEGTNYRTSATWRWNVLMDRTCYRRAYYGNYWECTRTERLDPAEWTGNYSAVPWGDLNRHDQMAFGVDCTASINDVTGYRVNTGRGRSQAFTLSVAARAQFQNVGLKAKSTWSATAGAKFGLDYFYEIKRKGDDRDYWAFVPSESISDHSDPDAKVCPPANPGTTYTASTPAALVIEIPVIDRP